MLKFTKLGQLSRNFLNNCSPNIPLCRWDCQNEYSPINQFLKRWQYMQQYKQGRQKQQKWKSKRQKQRDSNDYCYQQQLFYQAQQDQLNFYRQKQLYEQQLREAQEQQQNEQFEREQQLLNENILKEQCRFHKSGIKYKRISPEFFSMLGDEYYDTRAAPVRKTSITDNAKAKFQYRHLQNKRKYGSEEDFPESVWATTKNLSRASYAIEALRNRDLQSKCTNQDPLTLENASPAMATYLQDVMDQDGITNKLFGIDFKTNTADKDKLAGLRNGRYDFTTNSGAGDGIDGLKLVDPFTAAHLLRSLKGGMKLSPEQKEALLKLLTNMIELEPDQLLTYLRMLQAQGVLTPDVIKQILKLLKSLGLNPNDLRLKIFANMLRSISKEEENRLLLEEQERAREIEELTKRQKKSVILVPIIAPELITTPEPKKRKEKPPKEPEKDFYAPINLELNWGSANDMINNVRRMTNPNYNKSEFKKSLDLYAEKFKKKTYDTRNELSLVKHDYGQKSGYTRGSYRNVVRTASFYELASKLRKNPDQKLPPPPDKDSFSRNGGGRLASFMWTGGVSETNLDELDYYR